MHYRAPPLPVDLRFLHNNNGSIGVVDPYSLNSFVNNTASGTPAGFARPTDGPVLPAQLHTATGSGTLATPGTVPGIHSEVPRSHPTAMEQENTEIDREAHMKQFRQIALNRHNIRLN